MKSILRYLAIIVCLLPTLVQAQGSVELTEQQVGLNAQAFEAAIAGEHDKAVRLLKASLNLGEANVVYLNLGRSLFNAGQCAEAVEAYNAVEDAPAVADPPPDAIAELLTKFRQDVSESCPGWLSLTCESPGTQIDIDANGPTPCPLQPVELSAGPHRVVATLGTESSEHTLDIRGGETAELTITLAPPKEPENGGTPTPRVDEGTSLTPIAWALIGTGGAAMLAGLIVELAVLPDEIDAYEAAGAAGDTDAYNEGRDTVTTLQGATLGLYIGGGLLIAGGVAWLLLAPDEDDAPKISGWIGPERAGLSLTLDF